MRTDGMDHRCGRRQPVAHTVLLRRVGWAGYLVGELVDVSITGARVSVPPRAFPLRSVVKLEMTVTDGGRSRLLQVPAMVVRHAAGGIALMFDQVQPARAFASLPRPEAACA